MHKPDDIQYALEMTRVIHEPDRMIDTFGTTSFEFHLISELMDHANQVRIREGRISAERPRILRPEGMEELLFEGFGEQADAFRDWLKIHGKDIAILKYGFNFARSSVSESIVHESVETVCDRVVGDIRDRGNPLSAVICGVDDAWEICLLKFTTEMILRSQGVNLFDFRRRGLL